MTKRQTTTPTSTTPDPLIPLRTLVILTASVLVGVIAVCVTYVQWHQPAQAFLAGAASALGCARQLHTWTGT